MSAERRPNPARDAIAALRELTAYDVSPVFHTNMPGWGTHPTMGVIADHRSQRMHGYYAQTLVLCEHTGSHVDAPIHNHPGREAIDAVAVDALIRPYKKYALAAGGYGAGDSIELDALRECERRDAFGLDAGDIAVLEVGWDRHYKPEDPDPVVRDWWGRNQPGLARDACCYLAEAGVTAVACDTAACDLAVADGVIRSQFGHQTYFLPRGILIVEGLQRLAAAPAQGLFVALPLPIRGGSGSPIRVALYG
jgi:kynurenine formamidase